MERGDGGSQKQPRKKDSFQRELQSKLKERRARGLSVGITSPELSEEESEDDRMNALDDKSDDDDFLSQFITSKKSANRPTSAKQRQIPDSYSSSQWRPPALGDTIRHADANAMLSRMPTLRKQYSQYKDSDDEDDGDNNLGKTEHKSFLKTSKLSTIRPQPSGSERANKENLTKEEIIFGKKSPNTDKHSISPRDPERREWRPPSYRKTSISEEEDEEEQQRYNSTTLPVAVPSKGRKTPSSLGHSPLETVAELPTPRARRLSEKLHSQSSTEESPRPKPRVIHSSDSKDSLEEYHISSSSKSSQPKSPSSQLTRDKSPSSQLTRDKSPSMGGSRRSLSKTPPIDSFGRSLQKSPPTESIRRSRKSSPPPESFGRSRSKTPPTDIFGKPQRPPSADLLDEDHRLGSEDKQDDTSPARLKRRSDRVKSTNIKSSPSFESKSPNMFERRKSPHDEIKPRARFSTKSPAASLDEPSDQPSPKSKRSSVLDFLTADVQETKTKAKPRAPDRTLMRQSQSLGSDDEEENAIQPKASPRNFSLQKRSTSVSSLCDEVEEDPSLGRYTQGTSDYTVSISKSQRSDRREADEAIAEVYGAQREISKSMRYIDPDESKTTKPRSKSADAKMRRAKPKPRYPRMPGELTAAPPSSFDDTITIRTAIFAEWYKEKMKSTKENMRVRKKAELEVEEKKQKAKEDKETDAKMSYNAWVTNKREMFKERAKEKRTDVKKKEADAKEKEDQKHYADKTFKIWKEVKDVKLKETYIRQKKEELNNKRNVTDEKRDKQKLSVSAYKTWKEKKDDIILKNTKEEKRKTKYQERNTEKDQQDKDRAANQRYWDWIKAKEQQDQNEKTEKRRRKLEDLDNPLPPWSPANRTVPFGR